MSTIELFERSSVELPMREVYRYMGFGANTPPENVLTALEDVKREVLAASKFRACFLRVPVRIDGDTVDLGFDRIASKSLRRNLDGCREAWLFCATIGVGADRLIARYAAGKPSASVMADAVATAAIEAFCDELCDALGQEVPLRPRFSPGYGDVPLEEQKKLLPYLDAARKVGVTLTDSLLMTPTKSVSAFAGIGAPCQTREAQGKCRACKKTDCAYRREDA